ncbi:MAG: hypothetical protein U0744_06220 [Gemmataceae bacterium]
MLWHFPLPQHLGGAADRETILAQWNRQHDGDAAKELRQMVLAASMAAKRRHRRWSRKPKIRLAASWPAMQEAMKRAADPKAFPEQIGNARPRA